MRSRLEELKGDSTASRSDIRVVTDRMDELLYREEMMWLQRSRIAWLREGDRNTSYFHRQAVWRAHKNKIKKLKRLDGEWCEDLVEMKEMASGFFRDLYTKDLEVAPAELLELLEVQLTDEMNDALC